jgi:hypothetical protein
MLTYAVRDSGSSEKDGFGPVIHRELLADLLRPATRSLPSPEQVHSV